MRKFKFYAPTMLILSVLFIGFSSCKKKCVIEKEGTDSGVIVKSVLVYPQHGYITSDLNGNYHIDETSGSANKFEMSTDGGQSRVPMNYDAYSILAHPMVLSCNFSLDREVLINDIAQTVTYAITVTECADPLCQEERFIENYVVVPSFPSTYTVSTTVSYVKI
jgi:hypothetical protein